MSLNYAVGTQNLVGRVFDFQANTAADLLIDVVGGRLINVNSCLTNEEVALPGGLIRETSGSVKT